MSRCNSDERYLQPRKGGITMTGEMHAIDPVTGEEPDGTTWTYHAAAAQAVGGQIKPFDQYTVFAPRHLGIIRLWLIDEGGLMRWYREDNDKQSDVFFTEEEAAEAARSLID